MSAPTLVSLSAARQIPDPWVYFKHSMCWLLLFFIHFELCPQLLVKNLQFEDGKMIPASKYFSAGESSSVELTEEEKKMAAEIRASKRSAAMSQPMKCELPNE